MINTINLPPFKKMCITIGNLPSSFMESMTYYEALCWLYDYFEKTLLPAINTNSEAITELQNAFTTLKTYVDTYFDNLDIQTEINNKLDDMAESGELTDIIAQYLGLAGVLAYDNKAAMKSAENISNGSICKTLGDVNYNDGKGAFYKVRNILNTDIIDDENIIALHDVNLVAQKILYSSGYDLQVQINDLNNKIDKNILNKLSVCKNAYFYQFDIKGNKYGLSYEKYGDNANTFSIQGVCVNPINGDIYANNGTEIFKLKNGKTLEKEVLYTINLGHGGDCCIFNNNMYVIDYNNYRIHKVNLTNGNDTTYDINTSDIINELTEGTPRIGGICIDTNQKIYLAVNDEYEDHTQIADNSTLRIYEYSMSDESINKIFETTNSIVYIQGMTHDNDNFYICGNKAFDSSYTGNKIFIINKLNFNLIDTLENNNNLEFEGLDYCSLNGVEGLITSLNNYGSFSHVGVYSFYGNCTRLITETGADYTKLLSISRGGQLNVDFEITGTYNANQTYTIQNFLGKVNTLKMGGATSYVGFGKGASRTDICLFEYVPSVDELRFYPTTNLTIFACNFTVPTF